MAERRTAKTTTRKPPRKPKEAPRAASSDTDERQGPKDDATKAHVCPVAFCPIGMALTSVQGAGPDVIDHLLAAAREFFLAARAVMDARGADFDETKAGGSLERIQIG